MILEVPISGFYNNDLEIPVLFSYNQDDAAAVQVIFLHGPTAVPWTFSRDLLARGMFESDGEGDIKVYPAEDRVMLSLRSPNGKALIGFDKQKVAEFIQATFAVVPLGHEFDGVDWDLLLQE